MKSTLTADWSPHIEATARVIAAAAVACYVAGYCFGTWLHNLNDALAALLVRKRGISSEDRAMCLEIIAQPVKVQRYAIAAIPARCGILPPTPMARAIVKVRAGMSQRQAASLCGVSRSSLQRALKA